MYYVDAKGPNGRVFTMQTRKLETALLFANLVGRAPDFHSRVRLNGRTLATHGDPAVWD